MNSLSLAERQTFDSAFQKATGKTWNSEFLGQDSDWENKFNTVLNSLNQNNQSLDWEEQFKKITAENDSINWNEKFQDIFGNNEQTQGWSSEFIDTPKILDPDPVTAPSKDYIFEVENHFMSLSDPYSQGLRLLNEEGQLSQAALAFEAAVQKDPSNSMAWFHLGVTQAENEKESPAILALEKSVKEDPRNAPALMVIILKN